jgi:hypothetical protein
MRVGTKRSAFGYPLKHFLRYVTSHVNSRRKTASRSIYHHVPNKPCPPKARSLSQLKLYLKVPAAVVSLEHAGKSVILLRQYVILMHLIKQYTLRKVMKFTTQRPLEALHPIVDTVLSIPRGPLQVPQVNLSLTGLWFHNNCSTLSEVRDHMKDRKKSWQSTIGVTFGSTIRLSARSLIM